MKHCKYVFKKGNKKGTNCKNTCKNDEKYCSLHIKSIVTQTTNTQNVILKNAILNLGTSNENKKIIMKHYYNMRRSDSNSTEHYKNQIFVDFCLSYPWDKSYNIQNKLTNTSIKNFIESLKTEFDKHIYGMENVKNEIINIICKFITNPNNTRNNIALYGNAGVAKTKFIKILSQVLNIPMKIISLGGIKDSSFFLGHGYVYVESGPGKILQNIIDSQVNNPIIYFDELDKVSQTENGKDVFSFLTFLTDPTQNNQFTDHYFYGMKFDLSKVFYIFSFNDISKIDKILLDRLNLIYVETPSEEDICIILTKYCIPEIIENIGIPHKVYINKKHIIQIIKFCDEYIDKAVSSGIREYYRFIEKLLLELNKNILLENVINNPDPDNENTIYINDELFSDYFNIIKKSYNTLNNLPSTLLHLYI